MGWHAGAEDQDLDLAGVELATLGGTFDGDAHFRKFERFETEGMVTGFDARTLLAIYSPQTVPWDGLISGPVSPGLPAGAGWNHCSGQCRHLAGRRQRAGPRHG